MTHHTPPHESQETAHLVERVVARIEGEHVTPRSRWLWRVRNYALWSTALAAVVVASFAAAAMFFILANAGWQYASITHGTFFALLMAVVPSVWLGAVVVSVAVAYWNIRSTKYGYRYPLSIIAAGVVLVSLLSGAALLTLGWGQEIEEGVGQHLPFYRPFLQREQSWWTDEADGRLIGSVTSLAPDFSSFVLKTANGASIPVDAHDLRLFDVEVLARGGIVRVVGVPIPATSSATRFHACFVLPWSVFGSPGSHQLPLPIAVITASTSERIPRSARSDICKGVRPYASLHSLEAAIHE